MTASPITIKHQYRDALSEEFDLPDLPAWIVLGTCTFLVLGFGASVFFYFVNFAPQTRSYIRLNHCKYTELLQHLQHLKVHRQRRCTSQDTANHSDPIALYSRRPSDRLNNDKGLDLGLGISAEHRSCDRPSRRRYSTGDTPIHQEPGTQDLARDPYTPSEPSRRTSLSSSAFGPPGLNRSSNDLNISLLDDEERELYLEMSSSIDGSSYLDDSDVWSEGGGGWWLVQRADEEIDAVVDQLADMFSEDVEDAQAGLLLPIRDDDREFTEVSSVREDNPSVQA